MLEGIDEEYPAIKEIVHQGVLVQVTQSGEDLVIQRVISSNPQDYLRPDLMPGTVISAKY